MQCDSHHPPVFLKNLLAAWQQYYACYLHRWLERGGDARTQSSQTRGGEESCCHATMSKPLRPDDDAAAVAAALASLPSPESVSDSSSTSGFVGPVYSRVARSVMRSRINIIHRCMQKGTGWEGTQGRGGLGFCKGCMFGSLGAGLAVARARLLPGNPVPLHPLFLACLKLVH